MVVSAAECSVRFNRINKSDRCCVVISPELCPELALYASTRSFSVPGSPYACENHKIRLVAPVGPQEWRDIVMASYNGGPLIREDRGVHTCWYVIPDVECPEKPTWDFLHMGPDDRWKICEKHTQEFKAMRVSFDVAEDQGGYDAKRICTCSSKILWSAGCQCGAP